MATLKKKEFIAKVKELNEKWASDDLVWVCANYSTNGDQSGWVVGFSQSDGDQYVLSTDKGFLRNFKTADAAIDFVATNDLTECSVRVDYA